MQGTRLKSPLLQRFGPKSVQVPRRREGYLLVSQHLRCSLQRAALRPCLHAVYRFHYHQLSPGKITAKERRLVLCPKTAQSSAITVYPSFLFFFPESITFPSDEHALWRCLALPKKLFFGMPQLMQRNIVAFHPFCLLEPKST